MIEAASAPIRVLVVDDDPMVRETLSLYLSADPGLSVVGFCADGAEAVAEVKQQPPDVVLMDIRMPVMDGITACREILAIAPQVRVVALTTLETDEAVSTIFESGGAGFLLKNTRPQALVAAVQAAHRGLAVMPPVLASRRAAPRTSPDAPALSAREAQVLGCLGEGLTNREIAAQLFVSESTVKLNLAALMRKLAVDNRTSVVVRAHELGLL